MNFAIVRYLIGWLMGIESLFLLLPAFTAVTASKAYVTEAIEYSLPIGGGCGPTHHFVDLYRKAGWLK